jgi:site-specific DNA-methyltransferase (adenine-specific)
MNHLIRYGILDSIFGSKNFRNEIVWCYSGMGNTKNLFSRRHDSIFWYTKGEEYTFNVDVLRLPYSESSMAAFKSPSKWGGKDRSKYRESGRLPEDWWTHIPSLKNTAERIGYPTQKPEKLLERIILASTTT